VALARALEILALILEALFLWISFFLEARSAKEYTTEISFKDPLFKAFLIAYESFDVIILLTEAFFSDDLSALFAVLVTGIATKCIKKGHKVQW